MVTLREIQEKYPFLYLFQAEVVMQAANRGSFLVAHECGLGKTVSCFAAAKEIVESGRASKILIVCPASIQKQWQSDIKKWFGADALCVAGTKKAREKIWAQSAPIKIISYESLRQDWPRNLSNTVVVADEVSKIKNSSKINRTFQAIAKTAPFRIGSSGTPLTGRLEGYYRIMRWINPMWMTYPFFQENYIIRGIVAWRRNKLGKPEPIIAATGEYKNLDDFVRRLDGHVDRKRKADVAPQLPPKTMEWREITMTPAQRTLEGRFLEYAKSAKTILPVWQLLHVNCDGSDVVFAGTSETLSAIDTTGISPVPSKKIQEIMDIIEELGDEKVVIYSQFARFAKRIHARLETALGKGVVMLATGEDAKARDAAVLAFKTDPNVKYLVSTDTLSMGISFSDVNYLINADIPPDIGTFLQRCDRIHRLDSKFPKTIINLVSEGLEIDIRRILVEKAGLIEAVTEGKAATAVNVMDEISRKYGIGVENDMLLKPLELK